MKEYIVYKCKSCNKSFILFANEVNYSEMESKYITCPYFGKHKNIVVTGAFDDIKECMQHSSYKRDKGKIKQIK